MQRHADEIEEWRHIGAHHPRLRGEPLRTRAGPERDLPDVLAFDFAPSYNFNVDRFDFDHELRAAHRALRYAPPIRGLAARAARDLFDGEPFAAAHLRRDG